MVMRRGTRAVGGGAGIVADRAGMPGRPTLRQAGRRDAPRPASTPTRLSPMLVLSSSSSSSSSAFFMFSSGCARRSVSSSLAHMRLAVRPLTPTLGRTRMMMMMSTRASSSSDRGASAAMKDDGKHVRHDDDDGDDGDGDDPSEGGDKGWTDAMKRKLAPYGALARVDKPIGTWLLLWPGWWAIAMAGPPLGDHLMLLGTFGLGAFLMRGAGCTINDILDKDFDARVERTKSRPLASGALTRKQAITFLGVQLTAALGCLLTLNPLSIGVGAASLVLVGTYPLMKRITYWPQAFLGLTFNYGAILGWTAATGEFNPAVVAPLYASGICWTLVYDTIYAHQDKTDDALIGVKSTALLFGENTKRWLSAFAVCQVAGLTAAGMSAGMGWPYFTSVLMAGAHLTWQIGTVDIHSPADCARKFISNAWLGAFIFGGIELSQLLSLSS